MKEEKINEFVIFMIEMYKQHNNINGKDVYNLFKEYGVLKYLTEGYDMLHTQGHQYLLNDIDVFLKNHGYNQE